MCGIAGIIVSNSDLFSSQDLIDLGASIAHRGPDGEGFWFSSNGKIGLVHTRLAIIDTGESGNQPMQSADGRYAIVYNGEIFNFIEIRQELELLGKKFQSESDTEVVLQAWQCWGPEMLNRFNGMWAIAIIDQESGEAFFARDRFGIKPLHYVELEGRFAFASELRALRCLPWVPSDLDAPVVRRMLFDPFSIEGSDRTLFAAIRRLPGGHYATFKNGQLSVKRWWCTIDNLPEVPESILEGAERFKEIFDDAVSLRMRSDVPIGTCLSGGFDSSAIVGTMSKVAKFRKPNIHNEQDWRHAFVATFPGQDNDETPEAIEAATFADIVPNLVEVNEEDSATDINQILKDLDDVYISLPTAPWLIYRELSRSGLTVTLDGHGADELMGAYRHEGDNLSFRIRNFLTFLSVSNVGSYVVDLAKNIWLTSKGLNFLCGHRFFPPRAIFLPSDVDKLPKSWGALNRRLYRMFHATVLPTILRNFDRLSMAHGVEVRMPFMDWRLVTFAMALPDEWKSSRGYGKWIARLALKDQMPERIRLNRRKVGFNSPMPCWLNGPLLGWANAILKEPNSEYEQIVDLQALRLCVKRLGDDQGWNWYLVGRLWPYINLKWLMDCQKK